MSPIPIERKPGYVRRSNGLHESRAKLLECCIERAKPYFMFFGLILCSPVCHSSRNRSISSSSELLNELPTSRSDRKRAVRPFEGTSARSLRNKVASVVSAAELDALRSSVSGPPGSLPLPNRARGAGARTDLSSIEPRSTAPTRKGSARNSSRIASSSVAGSRYRKRDLRISGTVPRLPVELVKLRVMILNRSPRPACSSRASSISALRYFSSLKAGVIKNTAAKRISY